MDLYLDAKESELLTRRLEHSLDELRREIHHTDSRPFKEGLKSDEALLQGILAKLKTPAAMGI